MLIETIEGFKLSLQQEHLWSLQQDSAVQNYRAQAAILIEGNLKLDLLETALENIVARHEILRTNFQFIPEIIFPVQTITEEIKVIEKFYDLSDRTPQEQAIEIENIFEKIKLLPINLEQTSLFKTFLITLSPQRYILIISTSAMLADAKTLQNLVRELSRAYSACLQLKNSAEEVLQYVDFAEWQNEILTATETEIGREYWRKQSFSNLKIELPEEQNLSEEAEFLPRLFTAKLTPQISQKIAAIAKQKNTSVANFLLACWQTLLWRLTQQEFTIGIGCVGREHAELEAALGLFAKYLPLSGCLSDKLLFSQVLDRIKQSVTEIYRWQECFNWQNDQSDRPLAFFPVSFDFAAEAIKYSQDNVSFSLYKQFICIDRFNLRLSCRAQRDVIVTDFYYDSSRFDLEAIERLQRQFDRLVASVIENPEAKISALSILSDRDWQQLLVEFNQTETEYPQDECLHQLFEAQVAKTPDAVAVVFKAETLTYRELNTKANQLAHYLQTLGVKPEVKVGICVERSLEMAIALLAVLKAGGAYVPIEPSYPLARKTYILQDSQMQVLLTQQHLITDLTTETIKVICLDSDRQKIEKQKTENPIHNTTKLNLAYVIYTSGSTGKPKGVQIPHQGLVNYLSWCTKTYAVERGEGTLVHSPLGFDLTITSLLSPLLVGRTVKLLPEERSIETLSQALNQSSNLSLVKITPAHLDLLKQQLTKEEIAHKTRAFIIGGENLLAESITWWQDVAPETILVNEYGPTETVVGCCVYQVLVGKHSSGSIPIGKPIANTKLYILDRCLEPVPIGVTGELYIGGDGLARGYLNRAELTAAKFRPNPFSSVAGDRLYQTGDLARFLPSGAIEYLGRIDNQVKIRGFRIELGEIEAVMLTHPAIQEAVVIVNGQTPESQTLIAYLVPNSRSIPTTAELRSFIEAKLPDYMIPSAFVTSETLPLTPNGKIDRKALQALKSTSVNLGDRLAPSTPIEKLLAGIWTEILGIEQIGINHNFFEIGGHSLIATRVISQIRQVLGVELPLRSLFENPTIARLAKQIEQAIKSDSGISTTKIEPVSRSQQLPLSHAQQRLWFLAQLEPDSPFYNIPAAVHLQGELNLEALQQSFDRIIARHETLRTNFPTQQGEAVAIISEIKLPTIPLLDLRQLPVSEKQIQIQRQTELEAQQSFDISSELLIRIKILRLEDKEHILLLTMHHIIADGWSINILIREIAILYQAFCQGQTPTLSELTIQYVDFAVWQRQWLQGETLETQKAYWLKQLENAPKILELPTDYPRPAIQTFQGASHPFQLSQELSTALNKLSQQQGSTLFMTLLAAFQTLLWRYTAQEDIIVGSPIANRNRAEIEGLIGFFINTLVLRTNLAGNPSFEELLQRVRETALGAYAHQDLPFELLVEQLQSERDLSHTPLFQVMFVLQNAPMSALELPDLTLTALENESKTAQFDLTLSMRETEFGLEGSWEYNTDLFESATIARMVGHFQTLLEAIVANPQQCLSDLPILTQTEQQLLGSWNDTEVNYPQALCIHQLFEAQVERSPDAVAVVFEAETLTYRELNTKANQLAHYLQTLGVKPEVLVGICVERSIEMIIGLLAILKAGGAYVPLDPNYPTQRLRDILEDSQPIVLLTQQDLVASLPTHQAQTICIDSDWQLIAENPTDNPTSEIITNNLAYVIYTSGSTGKPKGVMIKHASTVAMLNWANKTFTPEARAGVLASTSICFDLSVFEIFMPLSCGGKIILIENALVLPTLPAASEVTLINTVPSIIAQLLRNNSIPTSVKTVNIAGEPLQSHLVQQLYQQDNIQQVFNLYGPSEDTTYSTYSWIQKGASSTPPIGRPIDNTKIYLLDGNLQPVPVGVAGMLYLDGAGLARGYLNRPEITADKFIPNPFANLPGQRLYQTGDLARYLPNGEIEYVGRIDNQVKLRGFRIELGEIEAVMLTHPAVREIVVVREESNNSKHLVAYVVPQPEPTLTIAALREFLTSKLPNYMIPSAFVTLEALPLTPNGKVDRKALPAPDTDIESDRKLIAPRNLVETKLTEIWTEVLDLQPIGIFDNFFDLGGDSILAIMVITKTNQVGLQLSVKQLFQHQTIADLASIAVEKKIAWGEQEIITGSTSLTPIQHWFFEQNFLEPHHWNQAVLLEVKQVLDFPRLEKSVRQLLLHHDALRLRFEQTESGWQQAIARPDFEVPVTHLDFSALSAREQERAIATTANELQASLDLSTGSLIRVALFDLGKRESRLLIVIHHLAVDGVSWRILLEDLETVYQQLSEGKKAQLPLKTTSFKHWSDCLQEYARSTTLQPEWDYWLRESWQQITPLPVDFPNGDNTVASVRDISVSLTAEQTQALLKEVPKAYNSQINDVLLTALVRAFSQWTGSSSLLLALEGHGREEIFDRVDLSRTVGWFTSLFPVRLDLAQVGDPMEGLKLIKEQLRELPNRGMGYGILRYLSQDAAKVKLLRSHPQPQVVFNYLGQFDGTFSNSSMFKFSQDSPGQTQSPLNRETYLLDINALVIDRQLTVNWKYSEVYRRSTIEQLAQNYIKALQAIVTNCQTAEIGYTPSDFPDADLNQQDLDRLLGKIK